MQVTQENITIKPCPQRIKNITTAIQQALQQNTFDPATAQKLAGKCSFTSTQLFGKVGRAATPALYDDALSHNSNISRSIRQGPIAMIKINAWNMLHFGYHNYHRPHNSPHSSAQMRSTTSTAVPNDVRNLQTKTYNKHTETYPTDGAF